MKHSNNCNNKTHQQICKWKHSTQQLGKPIKKFVKTNLFGGESGRSFSSKQLETTKPIMKSAEAKNFLLEDLEWFFFGTFFFHEEQKEKLKEIGFLMGTYLTLPCTKSFPSFLFPIN
jgi:hypothetical protein